MELQTVLLSIAAGAIAYTVAQRLNIPAIVLYLGVGILLGPQVLNLIVPDQAFGDGLNVLVIVFVSVILFEGGLSLDFQSLHKLGRPLTKLIIVGIVLTLAAAFISAHLILGLSAELAIIFASLSVVTGPTVIAPIVKRLQVDRRVKFILSAEAVLIDAIGAILAIVVLEFIIKEELVADSVREFAVSLSVGIVIGALFGLLTKYLIRLKNLLSEASRSVFVLGLIFLCYFVGDYLYTEAGIMAVAVFGLVLSSLSYRQKESLVSFKDQLSSIIISILFIVLAASFDLRYLSSYWLEGLLIILSIVAARLLASAISTRGEGFSLRESLFIGWVGPRGIIALSVASIAALRLESAGFAGAEIIEILIFMLIAFTVLVQGLSASWVAKKLDITVEGHGDLVILGINQFSLEIAEVWRSLHYEVLLVDSNEQNCQLAHQRNFHVLKGNSLDPTIYAGIDLHYFTAALACTPNNEVNALFCSFCKDNYGIHNLFAMVTYKSEKELADVFSRDDIHTAFGKAKKFTTEKHSFWEELFGHLTRQKMKIARLKVNNPEWWDKSPDELPIPDSGTILCLVRELDTGYIYSDSARLSAGDILYMLLSEDDEKSIAEELELLDVRELKSVPRKS